VNIFSYLSKEELFYLVEFFTLVNFQPGDIILLPDEYPMSFFIVASDRRNKVFFFSAMKNKPFF